MERRLLCSRTHRKYWRSWNQNVNLLMPGSHPGAESQSKTLETRTVVLPQDKLAKPETFLCLVNLDDLGQEYAEC